MRRFAPGFAFKTFILDVFDQLRSDNRREHRWDGITDWSELGAAGAFKFIVIRERLQAGGLAYCQGPVLFRIGMDIVMAVLRYVRQNCLGSFCGGVYYFIPVKKRVFIFPGF